LRRVLVAVALSEEEARRLEEIARRRGYPSIGKVLERALRLYLSLNTSSQALRSSPRASRRLDTAYP